MKRLRPYRRKMSWEAFERLPHRLGWKHEYYGGMARLIPSWHIVTFELDLIPRPTRRRGIRPVTPDDASSLSATFLDAFALAPDYVGYSMADYRRQSLEYIEGFFGTVRGEWSPTSVVATVGQRIIAAALIKTRPERPPLLDCVFVDPPRARQGWATILTSSTVNALIERGETTLRSCALLANGPSVAWHQAFGFRELPDLWVAQARYRHYHRERDRLERQGKLKPDERAALGERIAELQAEVRRMQEMERLDFPSVHQLMD